MLKNQKLMVNQLSKLRTALMLVILVSFHVSVFGQGRQVTGTVYDQAGETLPGVNVVIRGTTTGTVTNIDGSYSIGTRSDNDVLVFSFIGYLEEQVSVGNQARIDVTLRSDVMQLDEIVAIGYGVQKKSLNTGANLNVKGDDLQRLNTSNTMDALKGLSPGVSITQNSGLPGAGNKIFIRGIGTTGNYDPLYIVDGVAVGGIDNLSPSDIESIDILKDAASAAIYGSRGANGVVLVTTKKGRSGVPVVTYSGYYGMQNVYKGPGLLNAKQYSELVIESNVNAEAKPFNFEDNVPDWDRIQSGEWQGTNWFEEITQPNAPVQLHSINVTGGSDVSTFSLGASYLHQEGILGKQANNEYERINLRLNSEHVLFKNSNRNIVVLGQNLTYTNQKNPTIRTGNIYWSDVHNMVVASPFLPMWASSEDDPAYPYHYAINWNSQESNPVAEMINQSKWNTNNNNTIIGNAYLNISPIRNLNIRSSFGINNWYGSSRHWRPSYSLSDVSNSAYDYGRQEMNSGYTWTSTNTITYDLNLGNSNLTILAGNEFIKNESTLNIFGSNQKSVFNNPEYAYLDNFPPLDGENASLANFGGRDSYGWGMVSYFGRLSYDYAEKYLLTAVLRYDASSNFARGYRWGSFPSASAGWIFSNEDFMQDLRGFIDMAKLRASWGQNGNQDIGRNFVYLSTIDITGVNYFFGPDKSLINVGSTPAQVPNPLIEWEKSEQTNIGLDLNLMGNRMQFAFDWYQKDTKDWLVEKIASSMDGTNPPWVNGGLVRNKGIEAMLRWNENRGDFKYDATFTIAYNENEVIDIPSEDSIYRGPTHVLSQGQSAELFRAEVGFPIGYFWGYETDGIFQNEEEAAAWVRPEGAEEAGEPYFDGRSVANQQKPGDVRFVDKNNDGLINDDDKVMIGNPHPKFIVGLQLNFDYKGFYLNITGNGMFGHQVAMNYRSIDSYRHNFTEYDLGRWHGEGTSNRLPKLFQGAHRNTQFISDIFIHDADFFRISNMTIGYNFSKLSPSVPFKEARLYIAATNLHTFTKYPGMDPEVGYAPESWGSGIDLGLYPQARTFMIGTNITF